MDRRERIEYLQEALLAAMEGWQASIWTALPATVVSFNAEEMTIVAQPTVQARVREADGSLIWVTLPVLPDVPVCFPGGGGFTLTFPITVGDEVLIILASRCIDSWWQSGGVQVQAEMRMHDLSDGFAIPGPRSKPNVLTALSTESVQLRSEDGSTMIELDGDQIINIVAPGGINIIGPLNVTGDTSFVGTVTANGVPIDETHMHSGVTGGVGNTGPVVP